MRYRVDYKNFKYYINFLISIVGIIGDIIHLCEKYMNAFVECFKDKNMKDGEV